jgi:hypothetical protein
MSGSHGWPFDDLVGCIGNTPSNDNNRAWEIVVPHRDTFRSQAVVQRLAMVVSGLDISRRDMPNWMADQFLAFDQRKGRFVHSDRKSFNLPDIDSLFPDDGSFTWFSDLKKMAVNPPRQLPQWRVLPRLQLLYLAIAAWRPEVAAHVIR